MPLCPLWAVLPCLCGGLSNLQLAALGAGIAVLQAVIMGVCTWVLCFALLQLSMKAYKKRHAELENPKEDDDENE